LKVFKTFKVLNRLDIFFISSYLNLIDEIMSIIFKKLPRLILFLSLACILSCCSGTSERDPTSSYIEADSSLFHANIEIDLGGYGKDYNLTIKGVLGDSRATIKADSTTFFVNNQPMNYSVGRGNYYEEYPAFRMYFDKHHPLKEDTLRFSILLKDSTHYDIGYIYIKSLLSFIQDKNLYQYIHPDTTKPLTVNWGGSLPETLTIKRTFHSKNKEGGTTIESNIITQQDWVSSKPFTIPQNQFSVKNGSVKTFYITWGKGSSGKMTNDKIGGSINATATLEQEVIVEPE
jgi:hypothetical protein